MSRSATRLLSRPTPQGGFTLIEVVIALTILGLALAAMLSAFSGSLRLARMAQEAEVAMLIARSRIDELGVDTSIDVEDTSEAEIYNGTEYSFRIEVRDIDLLEEALAERVKLPVVLQEIKASVYWGDDKNPRSYELVSYRLTPPRPEDEKGAEP